MSPELAVLFSKEWRQLVRSKGAMASALALPALLLLVLPLSQIAAARSGQTPSIPEGSSLPPALAGIADDPTLMLRLMFPFLVATAGMVAPSIAASYTLVSERETRTIELLVALPARMGQVLRAKLLALLALSLPLTGALLTLNVVALLVLELASVGYALSLYLLLLAALAFSAASSLLVSLLARDFRTSNNLNGLVFGPAILVVMGVMAAVPGPMRAVLVLTAIFLLGAAACGWIAVRAVTFERLLR